jgi:hypothetical protein
MKSNQTSLVFVLELLLSSLVFFFACFFLGNEIQPNWAE